LWKDWGISAHHNKAVWERLPLRVLPLRLCPYFYIVSEIKKINRSGFPAMVYIHPWEIDKEQHALIALSRRFMHYFNISATPREDKGFTYNFQFAYQKYIGDLQT
ncbi:DUF3473 domain-containing protein, partial [Candidatus Kuenenia stuttgartensis]|uniref:DUF3473 domain-containing protein n=1 Tax=Kuenenia stuttgartiensis TaxID=174633 RepID=UPI00146F4EF8